MMQRLVRRAMAMLLAIAAASALGQARFDFDRTPTVLPKTVVPTKVQLRLDVDPQREQFSGAVAIDIDVRRPVRSITLHARELEADRLVLRTGGVERALRLVPSAIAQTWQLRPRDGRAIAPGRHRLELAYRGKVQRSGQGLYVVDHLAGGTPAHMLATQLEPISARRVLPCFDEPVFRTVFEVAVAAPPGYRVLSNTRLVSATPQGERIVHRFAPTPPMQSYLLTVAVGHFDVLEDEAGGVALRIFTAPGKLAQAAFAMESTRQVLAWYTQYFGRSFGMRKLDQLAVPGVRGGAMEDWGMISYEETMLLHDPQRSPTEHQRMVFGTIAHEVAHQWFGDLVSPASWSEIWLNEAFATWMERKAAAHLHPEWDQPLQSRRRIEHTMARDATPATRAIRSGPVDEASVADVFDDITYQKGSAVLSMIEQWIGPRAFRLGLASYMRERALRPATAGDLWYHIGRAAGQPVARMAATWTDSPGLPVLEVATRCDAGQTVVTMRRARFASLEPLPDSAWQVPVRVGRGNAARTALVGEDATTITFPGCEPVPVIANQGAAGYFRVDPAPPMRSQLAQALPALAAVDRLALVGDSFAMVLGGRRALPDHLALLASLPLVHDDGRAPLYLLALAQWWMVDEAFAGTPAAHPLRDAERALWAPELQRLAWEPAAGERSTVSELRAELVMRLAWLGDEPTLAAANERCAAAISGDSRLLAPSLRHAVLRACGLRASDAQFEAMHAAMLATPLVEEQTLLLQAMAASPDPVRARRLLEEAAAGRLPGSLGAQLVWFMSNTPGLAPLLYQFTVDHWATFSAITGDQNSQWLLPGALGWAAGAEQAAALARDQARLAGASGKAAADRTIADIRTRGLLREREAARLPEVLRGWTPRAGTAR